MSARVHKHTCLNATEVYRLGREEAYRLAGDCPLCVEFVDFVVRSKRTRASGAEPRLDIASLVREETLDKVLDDFDLHKRNRVMRSFDQVIQDTLAKLQPGQKMQLFSMGELLEAHNPYAFHEVISAVKRGVNLEYVLSSSVADGGARDIDLLTVNLNRAVDKNTAKHLTVKYSQFSHLGRKDVLYFDDSGTQKDRLIEVAYRMSGPLEGARRLWVRVEEKEREEFVEKLQST